MACGELTLPDPGLDLVWQFEQRDGGGDMGAALAHFPCHVFLGAVELGDQLFVGRALFHRIQVGALDILDDGQFQRLVVRQLAHHHRHVMQLGQLGGTPAGEGVENAINDDTSKYLNYGTDNDQNPPFFGPAGFEVTLSGGPAVVTGLRVYTANDVPERDPIDFKLEGSNDGTAFTTVATGPLALPLTRNPGGSAIDALALANQEVSFSNSAGYTIYRLTFTNVRDNAAANSMQIGEVELLGTPGAGSASLNIARNSDGTITITSSGPGTLESTSSLNPPVTWNTEGPIEGSTTVDATGAMRFFRVVQ